MVYRLRCLAIENPSPGQHPCRGAGTRRVRYPLSDESDELVKSDESDGSDGSDGSDALHKRTGLDRTPASEGCPIPRHRSRHEVPTTDV